MKIFTHFKFASFLIVLVAVMTITPPYSVSAQTQTVSGVVVDAATKQPMVGAAVVLKDNSSVGTSTDTNGKFTIRAKSSDTLVCSFFGYKNAEVAVGNRTIVNFSLLEDKKAIDEVVVVGYGTLKKAQLVGAVENISGDKLANSPTSTITRTLQGQVPGLNIIQTDGKPNHDGQIYVRGGATSYSGRTSMTSAKGNTFSPSPSKQGALILIDGVEGDISSVNPSDVENIAVLKDAASTAVYGSRGAYGVILITTKTPTSERITVNYEGSVSISTRLIQLENTIEEDGLAWSERFAQFFQGDAQTPWAAGKYPNKINNQQPFSPEYVEELRKRAADGYQNKYGTLSELTGKKTDADYMYYGKTNWYKLFYKPSTFSHTHNLSINASSKRFKYSLSGRFYDHGSIYKIGNEKFQQFNVRQKAVVNITSWLHLENNTSFFKRDYHQPMAYSAANVIRRIEQLSAPMLMPYNEDGTPTAHGVATGYIAFKEGYGYQNDKNFVFTNKAALTFDIKKDVLKFVADFSYKGKRKTWERISMNEPGYTAPGVKYFYTTAGYKSDQRYNTDYLAANAVLTWTPKLGDKHDLNAVAGYNVEKTKYTTFYAQRKGTFLDTTRPSYNLIDGDEYSTTNDGYNKKNVGVFGRINYTLLNRYILEFAFRADGSSLFPQNSQWGFFPSASFGWRLAEEKWMDWSRSWLDNFKIRFNVGQSGNANIDPYYFMELIGMSKSSILFDGNKQTYAGSPNIIPADLTWETVTTYDIGWDLDFLRNRLSFSGDYYWRFTDDMICPGPSQPNLFGGTAPVGNYGAMKTKGWELSLAWRDSFKAGGKDFTYSIRASLWDSRSFITDYYNAAGDILNFYKGKELGEIWGFRTCGIHESNNAAFDWTVDKFHKNGSNFVEYAGDLKFVDLNGDGQINYGKGTLEDHGDLDRIGNMTPRLFYGVNLAASWNGIGLSLFFQGVGKRDWYPEDDNNLFWGMYNRPYNQDRKVHMGNNAVIMDYSSPNWKVTNMDKNPYFTRQVTYAANRNVGPLAWENDHFLQRARYFRLKNITVDYTFPQALTRKWHIEKLRVYVSADNVFTCSPVYKHSKSFDPEVITAGDSDFGTGTGLDGVGQGNSYPMLRTFSFGVNLTF